MSISITQSFLKHRSRHTATASRAERPGRSPKESSWNTFSSPGSRASTAAVCATLSTTLGMPRILVPPFFGISTARTGPGKYDPDDMRFPQLVEVAFQLRLEPLYRHPVSPGRSLVLLHLQPCLPHEPFRNIVRLALRHRFSHAVHPFRLATFINQSDPAPWLHPHYRTSRLLRPSPPACLATGTQPLTFSAAWSSPSRRPP